MTATLVAIAGTVATASIARAQAQTDRLAEQAFKNVRVLKGVTESQFRNTMFFQRYALGVSCTYCHVDGQWEKDDKPAKIKARQMIQMVLDLNANTFKDAKAVNCVTCHRGAVKVQTEIEGRRISFDQMLGTPPQPASTRRPANDPTSMPSVDSVIAKYIAALGGADKLAKIAHTVATGTLITAEGMTIPYEEVFASSPNRWFFMQHFGPGLGDWSRGFDGTAAWIKDNRGISVQTGQSKGQMEMTAALQTGLHIKDLYTGLKVIGTDAVGSTPAMVLAGRATLTGRAERLYFDAATGLLLRRSTVTEGVFGDFTTDVFYEDYGPIDGMMTPMMISEFTPDFGTVRKLRAVDHDTIVSPAIFTKPPK